MQRNANVGSKLLALIAVPAVVLVAVASLGARERLDDAAQAQSTEGGARLAAASTAVVHELQLERMYSVRLALGDDTVADALAEQRAATDQAISLLGAPGDLAPAAARRYDAVAGTIQTIKDLRPSIDEGNADAGLTLDAYSEAIDGLLELDAALASRSGVPELAVSLTDTVSLSKAKEARALIDARVAAIATRGEFVSGDYEGLITLQDEEQRQFDRVDESQDGSMKTGLRNTLAGEAVRDSDAMLAAVLAEGVIGGSGTAGVEADTWQESATSWLNAVRAVEATTVNETIVTADAAAFAADKSARLYLIGTAGAVILSLLLATLLARRINRRLQRLTSAANNLATQELPRLVEDLRSPGEVASDAEPITPIEVDSGDEIGQLAEAFNAIQQVTSQVAEEQAALLRRGIADIFVNLARRNQSLLDRQIEFIDSLEAQEQDPDQLENLFKLDHLATRMRRNAESLLVLAGAEPPRRRARPVELADVVRVAIGEVEDFTRIHLLSLDDATVGGNTAVDMAHLLSELMENATQFSPPDSTVEVVGARSQEGGYVVTIADSGIGMSTEQLQEANALLGAPPPVGLALSRSLGFIVVGRLARRLGVSVRLTASPAGGITAVVELPSTVLAGAEQPGLPALTPTDGLAPGPSAPGPVDEPRPLTAEGEGLPAPLAAAPATLSDALPVGEDFERGLAALVGPDDDGTGSSNPDDVHRSFWGELADTPEDGSLGAPDPFPPVANPFAESPAPMDVAPPPPPAPFEAPPAPAAAAEAPAWEPAPDWLDGDLASVDTTAAPAPAPAPVQAATPVAPAAPAGNSSGLVRREPRATLGADGDRPRVSSTRRSPEEVRAMLSRYRRGLDDGRQVNTGSEE
jgi:signal transduction histidine kinase